MRQIDLLSQHLPPRVGKGLWDKVLLVAASCTGSCLKQERVGRLAAAGGDGCADAMGKESRARCAYEQRC